MAIQDLGGRREGQKFKSLLVWQILLRHTDENHPLSAEKIVELLEEEYGVTSKNCNASMKEMKQAEVAVVHAAVAVVDSNHRNPAGIAKVLRV